MSTSTAKPSRAPKTGCCRWWKRKWLRIAATSVVVVIVLGIVARMVLPTVLLAIGNRELSSRLAAPARLNGIDLGLLDYRVALHNLRINQPDGFGDDLFIDLSEAWIKLVPSSVLRAPLIIEEVIVSDLSVHVVRDKDGTLNVIRLLQPTGASPETNTEKPMHIKRIEVKNLTLRYTDFSLDEEPVDVMINRFDAVITDVYLDMTGRGTQPLPGRAEMIGHFVQPGFFDAPLGIIARFGPIDTGQPIPAAHLAIRLAGIELQPWHSQLPQGTSKAMGGDIMDFNVDALVSNDALDCTLAIVTPAGDALKLEVVGTPRQPQMAPNGIRGIMVDRAQEAGFNTLGNMGGTGVELGRTALVSAATVGKGAATTVWGTATGLFETAGSVSKGNLATGGVGLLGTLLTTVTDAGGIVGDTGASMVAGGIETVSAAGGGDRDEQWRADTQRRWARSWEQARKGVAGHGNADQ